MKRENPVRQNRLFWPKVCEFCEKPFFASRFDAKYCTGTCRSRANRLAARLAAGAQVVEIVPTEQAVAPRGRTKGRAAKQLPRTAKGRK